MAENAQATIEIYLGAVVIRHGGQVVGRVDRGEKGTINLNLADHPDAETPDVVPLSCALSGLGVSGPTLATVGALRACSYDGTAQRGKLTQSPGKPMSWTGLRWGIFGNFFTSSRRFTGHLVDESMWRTR